MARFDVHPGSRGKGYLLDCQAHLLSDLETRVVVPLMPSAGLPRASQLNPEFEIAGERVVMTTQLIFAIPSEHLGEPVGSLSDQHPAIMKALYMLMTGY